MSRWTVTYTKHVKQKRKVYQDGVLMLSSAGDKVSLYDDCEKLIDSRFLKKDEVVECGKMLAFETHLVDIGYPEVSCMSVTDIDMGAEDVELIERAGAQSQKPFYLGNKKNKLQSLPSKNYPNTLHGSIWENKKSTVLKKTVNHLSDSNLLPSNDRVRKQSAHCISEQRQLCPNETQKTLKEWDVLYTSQITQRAKKYHDGILKLVNCSSHMKQAVLLNDDGTILSSKYLKSAECIKTGQRYEFPNYLVEICACRTPVGDDTPEGCLSEVPCSTSTSTAKFTSERKDHMDNQVPKAGSQNYHVEQFQDSNNADASSCSDNNAKPKHGEWDVLYTSQITQKTKKFHDGILRLVNCVSNRKQVVLLNEDGTVLSSKYLKLTECVKTGQTYEFPNYLVEICAWRSPVGDSIPQKFISKGPCSGSTGTAKFTDVRKDCKDKPQPKVVETSNLKEVTDAVRSDSGMATSLNNRRIRDASQILFLLRRPVSLSESSDIILQDIDSKSKIVEVNNPLAAHPVKPTKLVMPLDILPTELDMEDTSIKNGCGISPSGDHEVSHSNPCTFPQIIQINSSENNLLGDGFTCTPVDSLEKYASSSSSSPEDIIFSDKSRIFSDEIVAMQQEWASLSRRVSTIGNTQNPTSLLHKSHRNESCEKKPPLAVPSPAYVVTEAAINNSELESIKETCLTVDDCPTFDLGFD